MITVFRTINGRVVPISTNVPQQTKLKKQLPKFEFSPLKNEYFQHSESFTNPNAQCPVCGKRVFYYEHPNGAKVYFEYLGPPWPKHPCTDNPTILRQKPKLITSQNLKTNKRKEPKQIWEDNGWEPCRIVNVKETQVGIGAPKGLHIKAVTLLRQDRIDFDLTYAKMKKLRVNKTSINKALIQSKACFNKIAISIHSGIYEQRIEGKKYKVAESKVKTAKSSKAVRNLLTKIEIQLPNDDGNLALFTAKVRHQQIFFIFDMNKQFQREALIEIIENNNKTLTLTNRENTSKLPIGSHLTIWIEDNELITLNNQSINKKDQFLSPSQKAKNISKRKRERGGNSILADAFLDALNEKK